ncbi:OmpA family protein [Desulfovibrio sp. OttesenSCG-928-C06]|nr:OmpA family protein [Desulfovibrio sp. OttesenSCG-928-C06]
MADEDDDAPRDAPDPPAPLGVPEWMVTYGDMMTLLLCFFVLLFIMSKSEEEQYKAVVGSIQNAFGVADSDPRSPFRSHARTPDQHTQTLGQAEQELMTTVQEAIMASQDSQSLEQSMIVDTENRGVVLRIYGDDLFVKGTAQLSKDAQAFLKPVIEAINRHSFDVLVRTNVTQGSLAGNHYASVWELSAARSGSALQALITYGNVKPTRLKAMGTGDTDLRVPPTDPKSEYYNNRTDFVFYLPGTEFW